jgi:hypothetical protein
MTLQWVEMPVVLTDHLSGDDPGLVAGYMWTAQGQGRHYTIAELPGFDELPGFRGLPGFGRWHTTVTADDESSGGGWLTAAVDEAKRRAEDYEQHARQG